VSIKLHNPTILEEAIAHSELSDMPDTLGTNSDHDARYLQDAPSDGIMYGRRNGAWENITLLPPVEEEWDITEGLPPDPEVGDRYISDGTDEELGWYDGYIYEWDGEEWYETIPLEGFMVWLIFEMVFWVFFSGGWMEMGSGTYVPYEGAIYDVDLGTKAITTTGDITSSTINLTNASAQISFNGDATLAYNDATDTLYSANDSGGLPNFSSGPITVIQAPYDNITLSGGAVTATTLTDGTATLTGGVLNVGDGSITNPSLAFVNETNTGLYIESSPYIMSFVVDGNKVCSMNLGSDIFGTNLAILAKTSGLAYSFLGDENTGIGANGVADNLELQTGGATRLQLNSTGGIITGTLSAGTLTDGTFSVTGGAITGASGSNSQWTNDEGYLTTLAFAGLSDYPVDAAGVLTNDGAGNLSWGAGGSSVSFGADNQIPYTNAGGDDFDYSALFTFDGSSLLVGTPIYLTQSDGAERIDSDNDGHVDIHSGSTVDINVGGTEEFTFDTNYLDMKENTIININNISHTVAGGSPFSIKNNDSDEDIIVFITDGGVERTAIQIHGDSGAVSMPRQSSAYVLGTSQTISNITWTILNMTNELTDIGSNFNTSTKLWTCPEDGIYLVSTQVQLGNNSNASETRLSIYKNGSSHILSRQTGMAAYSTINICVTDFFSQGDTIGSYFYQSSGGNLRTNGANTFLSITKIT